MVEVDLGGPWGGYPFFCEREFVFGGRSLYVVGFNVCIVEFKCDGCEHVQNLLVALVGFLIVDAYDGGVVGFIYVYILWPLWLYSMVLGRMVRMWHLFGAFFVMMTTLVVVCFLLQPFLLDELFPWLGSC